MIFDHTRKITHDLQLLIREPIAPFFFIHPLVYVYKLNGDLLFFFSFRKKILSFVRSNGYVRYYY